MNRLQQLQKQPSQALSQEQAGNDSQAHSASLASTIRDRRTKDSDVLSPVRLVFQASASQLSACSAYATSVDVASMRQPGLALQAVAAAANLVHEYDVIRKRRLAALSVVDLCDSSACVNSGVDEEAAAPIQQGRCLRVLRSTFFANVSIIRDVCSFAGGAKCPGPSEEIWAIRSNASFAMHYFSVINTVNRCEYFGCGAAGSRHDQ